MAVKASRWRCSWCLTEFKFQKAAVAHEAVCWKKNPSTQIWKKESNDE